MRFTLTTRDERAGSDTKGQSSNKEREDEVLVHLSTDKKLVLTRKNQGLFILQSSEAPRACLPETLS